MSTKRFTMRLSPDEERLLSSVAKLTGHTKADLVRSIMFQALESMLADKSTAMVDPQDFEKMRTFGSVGNFVSRTIITGGQSSKVAHFLYGFSAGFGVCGGGGGGAHA